MLMRLESRRMKGIEWEHLASIIPDADRDLVSSFCKGKQIGRQTCLDFLCKAQTPAVKGLKRDPPFLVLSGRYN